MSLAVIGPGFGRTGNHIACSSWPAGPSVHADVAEGWTLLAASSTWCGLEAGAREPHQAVLDLPLGRTPLSRPASVRTSIGGRRAAEAATEPGALVDGDQSTEGPDLPIRPHSGDGGPFSKIQPPDRRRAFAFGSGRLTSDSRYLNTRRPCSTVLYCRTNSKVRRHPNMSSYTTIP